MNFITKWVKRSHFQLQIHYDKFSWISLQNEWNIEWIAPIFLHRAKSILHHGLLSIIWAQAKKVLQQEIVLLADKPTKETKNPS
jgi:hypothetical protein